MRYILLITAALLAGCATAPERSVDKPDAVWVERQTALLAITSWDMRARLALRRDDEGAQVSLSWIRSPDMQRIDLAGPFGGGRVRITDTRDGIELRDSSSNVYRDTSLSILLARVTGWQLPLEAMRFWVLGLPSPAAPFDVELDGAGRPKKIAQLGWKVHFLDFVSEDKYELPRRMFIERLPGAGTQEIIEARMVIEKWGARGPAPSSADR